MHYLNMTPVVMKVTDEPESADTSLQCVVFDGSIDHHVPKAKRDYDRITIVFSWWHYH